MLTENYEAAKARYLAEAQRRWPQIFDDGRRNVTFLDRPYEAG